MHMKISYVSFLAMLICFNIIKCDDVNIQSILRNIRFIKKEKNPSFDGHIPLRIHASKGGVAFLTCIVKNISSESVSWIRHRDLHILTVNDYVFTHDGRFEILTDAATNWTLKINHVQVEDTGVYECQISTQPISSFSVYLAVLDPLTRNPIQQFLDDAIEDNGDREKTDIANDEVGELLKFPREDFESSTKILEGSEIQIAEGGMLNITCDVRIGRSHAQGLSKSKDQWDLDLYLIWFHDNKIVSEDTTHDGTLVLTKNSSKMIRSRLLILHANRKDSGNYTCHPFRFDEATVTVYITSGLQSIFPSGICFVLLYLYNLIRFCISP